MDNETGTRNHLPSFGRKNKYHAKLNSNSNHPLTDPDSFAMAESPNPPVSAPDSFIQDTIISNPTSTKPLRNKKTLYLIGGIFAGLILLTFAGIGIYSIFFHESPLNIEAERELRRAKDTEVLSEDDIPSKYSSEMTEEERENNEYIWYKLNPDLEDELENLADSINSRYMNSEITLTNAESEYSRTIESYNDSNAKAYLAIREADLIDYTISDSNEDENNIIKVGELLMSAEELFPTIASAQKLADWEDSYGSKENSDLYYQLMYQRQLDGNYIREINDNSNFQ